MPKGPHHHQPLEMAPQLLCLGHLVSLVMNPELDEVRHHADLPWWASQHQFSERKLERWPCSHQSLFPLEALGEGTVLVRTSP